MPSMRKMFRSSKKSQSLSSIVVEESESGSVTNGEQTVSKGSKKSSMFKLRRHSYSPMTDEKAIVAAASAEAKKSRRHSLPGKKMGKSLRNLLTRKSSSAKFEDSLRTAEAENSDSANPSWDQGSVADTALSMTPPRNQEKAKANDDLAPVAPAVAPMADLEDAAEEVVVTPTTVEAAFDFVQEAIENEVNVDDVAWLEDKDKAQEIALDTTPAVASLEDLGKKIAQVIEEQPDDNELENAVEEIYEGLEAETNADTEELEGEQIETESEASSAVPDLVDEEVPQPPSVPRNEDLMTLLNEASITTEVEEEVPYDEGAVKVKRTSIASIEPELEAIEETDESEIPEVQEEASAMKIEVSEEPKAAAPQPEEEEEPVKTIEEAESKADSGSATPEQEEVEEETMEGSESETEAESETEVEAPPEVASELAPETITAMEKAESIAVAELCEKENSSSTKSPTLSVLVLLAVLAGVVFTLFHAKESGYSLHDMELPAVDLSSIEETVKTFFGKVVEDAPEEEEVVEQVSVLHGGCKGVYCGFY